MHFACFAFVYTLALCARLKILRIRFSDSKNSDRSLTDESLLEAVLLPLTEAKSLCLSLVLFFNQKSFLFLLVQQKRQARLLTLIRKITNNKFFVKNSHTWEIIVEYA